MFRKTANRLQPGGNAVCNECYSFKNFAQRFLLAWGFEKVLSRISC